MRPPARTLCLVALLSLSSLPLAAQDASPSPVARDTTPRVLTPLTVVGRADELIGVAATASQGHVGAADLRSRPLAREGELLETVPGFIATQHSGDGKANQYFIRGFNLDHGTDFQTRIEGMPVNMVSHAHGQGYTDLNFLIPEVVEYLDYRLGVYHADMGDFGSAGGAEFFLARRLKPFAVATGGANGMARLAAGGSRRAGSFGRCAGDSVGHRRGDQSIDEVRARGAGEHARDANDAGDRRDAGDAARAVGGPQGPGPGHPRRGRSVGERGVAHGGAGRRGAWAPGAGDS
ncbi:MAG TPA: Plug domain-containing protein [Gemmatimonadales bacterium]|nr:Plug domain-containing protein [Gemmatimonadales bacterium]